MHLKERTWYRLLAAAFVITGVARVWAAWTADPFRTALARHEEVWLERMPHHYRYTVEFGSASAFAGPVQIEVRNSIPVFVQQVQSGSNVAPTSFAPVNTIDKLFWFIRRTLEVRHDAVALEFDDHWGFPTRARMAENVPEGDTEIRVTGFASLP